MGKINICTTHTYYAYEHISYIYYEKILSISDCGMGKYILYIHKKAKKIPLWGISNNFLHRKQRNFL